MTRARLAGAPLAVWACFGLAAVMVTTVPVTDAHASSFVRVLSQRAKVRTAPGPQFRIMYVAERGEVLEVVERGTKGYWFRVELDDGSSGWVYGEQVIPFDVVDDTDPGLLSRAWRATKRAILAPTPVPFSNVELSFSAGVLGKEGMFLFRPAWLIDKYFAIEGFFGESPRAQETLLLAGLGWTLRLIPGGSLGPYINAGAGVAHFFPKGDAFTVAKRTLMAVDVGGGFEITVKPRITLRLDFRNWTLFDENETSNSQEYTGGLAIFF